MKARQTPAYGVQETEMEALKNRFPEGIKCQEMIEKPIEENPF